MNINKNDKSSLSSEYVLLQIRLFVNKKLYDDNIISFEVFKNVESNLLKKLEQESTKLIQVT